jgi:3-methyladenine DNA glycosylase AlkC
MADFKDEISPAAVARLGALLVPDAPDFVAEASAGLERLELLARVRHVAAVLARHLPADFPQAAAAIDAALASPELTGWITLVVGQLVADRGLDHPQIALPLLARLTPRWSSEGPIRPFIERHPDFTLRILAEWTTHPDEHVRRLVSEGTRPRLPWAPLLRGFIADPSPAVALLERLHDDPSPYVRRSVANHLNDIAKDHPDLALDLAERWHAAGSVWVARHGLRTLVKQGHPRALALLGFDAAAPVRLRDLTVSPPVVPIGGEVEVAFTLETARPARVVVDYLVHHAGARGPRAPKVFKLATRELAPGAPQRIARRHRFAEVTVRRLYPGPHRIEIQVNGRVLGGAVVELSPARPPASS